MTTYIMEALENYSAALVAQFNSMTQPLYDYSDQQGTGTNLDFGRRKIMYAVAIATGDTTTNNTGFTLWDGLTAVANGASVDTHNDWNLWFGEKDIDTGTVTFYEAYNVSNTVPIGVGSNATGSITFSANPSANQNIVLNGVTWTFKTSGATGTQTNIGATLGATLRQLSWDLNLSANSSINVAFYRSDSFPAQTEGDIYVNYLTAGAGGDAYTLGAGTAGSSVSGATLTGGTNTASDGTWRRRTHDMSVFGNNLPIMIDPRTNNLWIHGQSCELYRFAFSDSFQQKISPTPPQYGVNDPVYPIGITSQWLIAFEGSQFAPDYNSPYHLYLIPPGITANETALDEILVYADYEFPTVSGLSSSNIVTSNFRWCLDHSGNVYFLSGQNLAATAKNYKLWKFTPPSVNGSGQPTSGGGFADVTPWSSSTGPNTNNSAYTTPVNGFSQNMLYFLPATSDFVALSLNTPEQKGESDDTYADYFIDCTFINVSGAPTFDYHNAFVTGYMTAAWAPTNLAGAAYAITSIAGNIGWPREHNLYLGATDYLYPGVDYTKRWLMFSVYPVVGGVVRPNNEQPHSVLVQYGFVSGSAPTALQVIDSLNWDAAYPTYASDVFPETVINASMVDSSGGGFSDTDYYLNDNGLYDPVRNAFWWSGASSWMYDLNPVFTPRESLNGGIYPGGSAPLPPFLWLSFGTSPPAGDDKALTVSVCVV